MLKHETRTDWDGANVYEDIFCDGVLIGRAWVGGENEEYDGDLSDSLTEISEDDARERMGDEKYDQAVASGECVRFD